jgi:hypothetical protein
VLDRRCKALPHQFFREIDRRGDQNQSGYRCRRCRGALPQCADEEQRQPAAHGRSDQDLRAAAAGLEHRERVFEPTADRSIGEGAARFPVAGIIETRASPAGLGRPMRQRFGLGALHVGLVTGQPEQPGSGARLLAHRNAATSGARSNVQEFQGVIIHACGRRHGGDGGVRD